MDRQRGATTQVARPLPARLDPRLGRPPRPNRRSGSTAPAGPPGSRARTPAGAPVRRPAGEGTTFGQALGLTVLGAVLPGLALVVAGRRVLGWSLLGMLAALAGGVLWLATAGRPVIVRAAVDATTLLGVIAASVGVAIVWALVIIAGYRMLAPDSTTRVQHAVGGLLVVFLALGVAAPAFEVAHLASVQRQLIGDVFADGARSATTPAPDVWAGKERVNILLLGGDGGDDRAGVRTDTIIVASIDTATGATTTFSLPRNLQNLPFPQDSPLAEVYPDGFWAGSESESLLNAVYRNGPSAYPDILGPTDNPGADFLKLGVGEALGLTIDYYVLVNLDGFSRLIDALGGVTVNVNYFVPIGGEPTLGHLPDAYIAPGPDQLMDGERALHYARGRFGLDDYLRMDRQRCLVDAIITAADPMTLLGQYQEIAATTSDIVTTDIPPAVAGDLAALALDVKNAGIESLVFDDTVISPAYPDYDEMRALVQTAISEASPGSPAGVAVPPAQGDPAAGGAPAPTAPEPAGSSPVTESVDACAYDPAAAAEALAEGQPPTA